jgi:hypothetical protein
MSMSLMGTRYCKRGGGGQEEGMDEQVVGGDQVLQGGRGREGGEGRAARGRVMLRNGHKTHGA